MLVMCLLLFVACENQEIRDFNAKLEMLNDVGYFPLHVGNFWELSNGTVRYIDSVFIFNDIQYHRLITTHQYDAIDTTYFRLSVDGKVFQRMSEGNEILKFDIRADVGTNWTYKKIESSLEWTVHVRSKDEIVAINEMELQSCFLFHYDIPQMADEEHNIWLAPNIGIIEEKYSGGSSERIVLDRAMIKGIEIEF